MKRIVRLTESDLARIVRRVMNEEVTDVKFAKVAMKSGIGVGSIFAPGEVATGTGGFYNFDEYAPGKLLSVKITPTPEATALGLTAQSLVITLPATAPVVNTEDKNNTTQRYGTQVLPARAGSYSWSFTTPRKAYTNSTGKGVKLFTLEFSTNDRTTPVQTIYFSAAPNTQFGNAAAAGN
jgi:hypothetical protein